MIDTTTLLRGVLATRHDELVHEQREHRLAREARRAGNARDARVRHLRTRRSGVAR